MQTKAQSYKVGFTFNPLVQQLSENSNIFCFNLKNREVLIYDGRKYIYIYEIVDNTTCLQKNKVDFSEFSSCREITNITYSTYYNIYFVLADDSQIYIFKFDQFAFVKKIYTDYKYLIQLKYLDNLKAFIGVTSEEAFIQNIQIETNIWRVLYQSSWQFSMQFDKLQKLDKSLEWYKNGKYQPQNNLFFTWDACNLNIYHAKPQLDLKFQFKQVAKRDDFITQAYFSYTYNYLLIGHQSGNIKVWAFCLEGVNTQQGEFDIMPVHRFEGHRGKIVEIFEQKHQKEVMCSLSMDFSLRLWNIYTFQYVAILEISNIISDIFFINSYLFFCKSDGEINQVTINNPLKFIHHHNSEVQMSQKTNVMEPYQNTITLSLLNGSGISFNEDINMHNNKTNDQSVEQTQQIINLQEQIKFNNQNTSILYPLANQEEILNVFPLSFNEKELYILQLQNKLVEIEVYYNEQTNQKKCYFQQEYDIKNIQDLQGANVFEDFTCLRYFPLFPPLYDQFNQQTDDQSLLNKKQFTINKQIQKILDETQSYFDILEDKKMSLEDKIAQLKPIYIGTQNGSIIALTLLDHQNENYKVLMRYAYHRLRIIDMQYYYNKSQNQHLIFSVCLENKLSITQIKDNSVQNLHNFILGNFDFFRIFDNRLFLAINSGDIQVFNINKDYSIWTPLYSIINYENQVKHQGKILSLDFNQEHQLYISCGEDQKIKFVSFEKILLFQISFINQIECALFCNKNYDLVISYIGSIFCINSQLFLQQILQQNSFIQTGQYEDYFYLDEEFKDFQQVQLEDFFDPELVQKIYKKIYQQKPTQQQKPYTNKFIKDIHQTSYLNSYISNTNSQQPTQSNFNNNIRNKKSTQISIQITEDQQQQSKLGEDTNKNIVQKNNLQKQQNKNFKFKKINKNDTLQSQTNIEKSLEQKQISIEKEISLQNLSIDKEEDNNNNALFLQQKQQQHKQDDKNNGNLHQNLTEKDQQSINNFDKQQEFQHRKKQQLKGNWESLYSNGKFNKEYDNLLEKQMKEDLENTKQLHQQQQQQQQKQVLTLPSEQLLTDFIDLENKQQTPLIKSIIKLPNIKQKNRSQKQNDIILEQNNQKSLSRKKKSYTIQPSSQKKGKQSHLFISQPPDQDIYFRQQKLQLEQNKQQQQQELIMQKQIDIKKQKEQIELCSYQIYLDIKQKEQQMRKNRQEQLQKEKQKAKIFLQYQQQFNAEKQNSEHLYTYQTPRNRHTNISVDMYQSQQSNISDNQYIGKINATVRKNTSISPFNSNQQQQQSYKKYFSYNQPSFQKHGQTYDGKKEAKLQRMIQQETQNALESQLQFNKSLKYNSQTTPINTSSHKKAIKKFPARSACKINEKNQQQQHYKQQQQQNQFQKYQKAFYSQQKESQQLQNNIN